MLETSSEGRSGQGSRPSGERVGVAGVTDRPMPLYSPHREPVTYGRGSLWIVIGVLVVLFTVFFGWVLFTH